MSLEITPRLLKLRKSIEETKSYAEKYQPRQRYHIENISSVRPEYEDFGSVEYYKNLQKETEDFSGPLGVLKEARQRPERFTSDWGEASFIEKLGMMSAQALQPGVARKEAPGKLVSGVVELKNKPYDMIAGLSRKLGITEEGSDTLQDLVDKKKRAEKIGYQEFIAGLTGGILKPETGEEAEGFGEKLSAGIAHGIGAVIAIGKISQGWKAATSSKAALVKFISKNPKLYKYVSRSVPFMAYGQLDPDLEFSIKQRANALATDAVIGQVFGRLGDVKSFVKAAPAAFGLGAGMAWLSGEEPEDILISGLILMTMEGAFRYGFRDRPTFTTEGVNRQMREESFAIFNKYGKLSEGYTKESISAERKILAKKYHPDVKKGNENIMKQINNAYDVLTEGKAEVIKVEKKEGTFSKIINKFADFIKGKRDGNKYDGDVMEARKIRKLIGKGETITNTELQTRINESDIKPETKKGLLKDIAEPAKPTREDLDIEIDKRIEKFREEADLKVSTEGAGVRQREITDATGGHQFMAKDFKLSRAKGDMKSRAEDSKEYAEKLLIENDPEFKKLVEKRDALAEGIKPKPKPITKEKFDEKIKKPEVIKPRPKDDYTRLVEADVPVKQQLKQVIGDYLGEQKEGFFDTQVIAKEVVKQYSEAERKAAVFVREKTGLPKNIADVEKKSRKIEDVMDSPKTKELATKMGNLMDMLHKKLQGVYGKDIGFIKDYITHIWELEGKAVKRAELFLTTQPKYLKKRKIATYLEGIEAGYIPKTLDIAEIVRNYSELYVKAITNKKLVDTFLEMKIGKESLVSGKELDGYVEYDNPQFNKWRFIGRAGEEGILLAKKPIYIPKEAVGMFDVIFENAWRGNIIGAVELTNAIKKTVFLTGSAFHPITLLEGAAANAIMMKVMWETLNPYYIGKALLTGESLSKAQQKVARDGLRHGLQVEPLTDYQRHNVDKMFNSLFNFLDKDHRKVIMTETDSKTGKVLTKAYDMVDVLQVPSHLIKPVMKAAHQLFKANNWFLWDFLHLKIKTFAYERLVKKYTKGLTDPISIDRTKSEVAQVVNDQFGGQNWEQLGVSKKMQQAGRASLLSFDWTTSTARQAAGVTGFGARFKETKKVRMKASWEFWMRAAVLIMGSVQIANYLFTKSEYGEGRTTLGNAPGKRMDLFIGRFVTGEEKYARTMKQFREMIELMEHPWAFFGRKTSPVIQDISKQMSGYTPSGWKTEWAGNSDFWDTLDLRAKDFFGIRPFSVRGYQETEELAAFALPITKGMSNFRAEMLMIEAIKQIEKAKANGNDEGEEKAQVKLEDVMKHAKQNALDVSFIYETAKREVELGDRDERRKHKLKAVKLLLEGGEKNEEKAFELIKDYNLNITAVDIADIKKRIKLTK